MPRYKVDYPQHRVSDVRGAFYWLRRRFKRKRPCSLCQNRELHARLLHKRVLQLESENRELREENHSLKEEDRQTYSRVQQLINDISMPRSRSTTHPMSLTLTNNSLSFYSVQSSPSDDNTIDYDPHQSSPYTII